MTGNLPLRPRWFFAGVTAGFLTCCLLGWNVTRHNFYPPLNRFNKFTNASSAYYPTLSQMRRIAQAQSTPEQILVIVGGDSIFNGSGQDDATLWTRSLQKKLGDRYCVLNFALPGSRPPTPVLFLARNLRNSGRKVIFLCNTFADKFDVMNWDKQYRPLYWEAYFTGMAGIPSRDPDAEFASLPHAPDWAAAEGDAVPEARESSRLDSWFHFRDLWDYVSYRHFSTYWHPIFNTGRWLAFLKPRKSHGGDEGEARPLDTLEKQWTVEMGANPWLKTRHESYRDSVTRDVAGRWVESAAFSWDAMDETVRRYMTGEDKSHALLVFVPFNPWYAKAFDKNTADAIRGAEEVTNRHFIAAGCNTVMDDVVFQPEDFVDYHHLSSSGGEKVATMVTPGIVKMADRLGYLKPETP